VTPSLGEKLALELEEQPAASALHETLSDRSTGEWMIASDKTVRQIADEMS